MFEILDRDPGIADAPDALPLPLRAREITLDDVSFAYEDGRTGRRVRVLSHVSLTIKPGEMVAFVGASGAGKSTLLNLLPRFYDPTGGAVRYDGVDARPARVKDLRRHVALVLQDSVILPTTVAENIAYGRPQATREQVREAARLAGAAEFIERLPDGYDTQLTEAGQNLSGGQRQRISIARALLSEAPCVVLDEPTSALDPHHEAVVTRSLAELKGARTIVLVGHRLSTVAGCDRIYVMDGGRVSEAGRVGLHPLGEPQGHQRAARVQAARPDGRLVGQLLELQRANGRPRRRLVRQHGQVVVGVLRPQWPAPVADQIPRVA